MRPTLRSTRRRILFAAGCLLLVVSQTARAQSAASDVQKAQDEYDAGRYANALVYYERASEAGSAQAAEVAGQMLLYGPTLYGAGAERDLPRAMRHLTRAAQAGRPVPARLLQRIGFMVLQPKEVEAELAAGPYGC